jgi:hypothetical protein
MDLESYPEIAGALSGLFPARTSRSFFLGRRGHHRRCGFERAATPSVGAPKTNRQEASMAFRISPP